MNVDYQLFELINRFAGKIDTLDQLIILFSKYGPVLFGLVFVWLWFSKKGDPYKNKQIVLLAFTVVFITLGLAKLMELSYFRPRPFVSHSVNLLSDKSSEDPSFPSNHAAGAFAFAIMLFWRKRKVGVILLFFAVLMALSRIYIGVHYPTDVTAGALIALLAACLVIWQRRFLEPPFHWIITHFSRAKSQSVRE